MIELQDFLDFRKVVFEIFIKACQRKDLNMIIESIYTIRIIKDEMSYFLMRKGYNQIIIRE